MTNTSRRNYAWVMLSVLLAIVSVVAILYAISLNTEREALRQQVLRQQDEMEELRRTSTPADAVVPVPAEGMTLLTEADIERLRRQGLQNPIRDLREDLMENPEIIPHEGILGGTMSFYVAERIHVISPQWAMAYFEDGHISGKALLSYEVRPDGEIEWTVLDTYLDV